MNQLIIQGLKQIKNAQSIETAHNVAELLLLHIDETDNKTFRIISVPSENKIQLIRALRESIFNLSLIDAKDMSEGKPYTVNSATFSAVEQACKVNGAELRRI